MTMFDEDIVERSFEVDARVTASDQVTRALLQLDRDPGTFSRWPFAGLDALTGPMGPGQIWFICAASGGGKTTFVVSVVDSWIRSGRKVYVMPLETRSHDFRTYLACMQLGVSPGRVLSGELLQGDERETWRPRLVEAYYAQTHKPMSESLKISELRSVNLQGLERGLKQAKQWGADVVVVDHIDHISGGSGENGYAESQRVNDAALRMAQDNDMLLVFTSQLNMSHSKGDFLSKYYPPKDEHVNYGSVKRRNATGMIGLYRPVRKPLASETIEEYANLMKQARRGEISVSYALEPGVMGIVAMKLRYFGEREGARALLSVRDGRVIEMPEADRYTVAFPGAEPRKVL